MRNARPATGLFLLVVAAALLSVACGSANTDVDPVDPVDSVDSDDSVDSVAADDHGLTGELDITDAILTNTSPDCADYDVTLSASVSDLTRAIMFDSGVTITTGTDSCALSSNGIPNHDFNDASAFFANQVAEVERSFTIQREPQRAQTATALSQGTFDGVLLNGVVIDLLSAGCYRPDDPGADTDGNVAIGCTADAAWLTNPLGTDHKFGADSHNAHTQPDGTYHYHGNPLALFDDNPGATGSPLIGWAADGFPIYGSYFVDPETGEVRKAISGYTLKAGDRPAGEGNPQGAYSGMYYDDYEFTGAAGDLDECNGMEVDGQYGYYVTDDFPYLMFCLTGTPDPSFDKADGAVGGAGDAPVGGEPVGGEGIDLTDAAATLGVTTAELEAALGAPPPDLEAAAAALGVSVEELEAALPPPP